MKITETLLEHANPLREQPGKHKPQTKKGIATFSKSLKDSVASTVGSEKFLSRAAIIAPTLVDKAPELDLIEGEEVEYRLVTGIQWAATPQLFQAGFARRWNICGAFRYSTEQKQFLNWAYNYGERKAKFTATRAAKLIKIVGTQEAASKYPDEEYLTPTDDGKPRFKWADYASKYEIKAFFGTLQQAKKKKNAAKANKKIVFNHLQSSEATCNVYS